MRYGAIARSLWQEPRFKALSSGAKLVACYLQTCPAGNSAHIFRIGPAEIGLACSRAVRSALSDIEAAGLAAFDLEHELVWLEGQMLTELGPSLKPNDKRVPFIRKLLDELPESSLIDDFLTRYGTVYHLKSKGPSKGASKGPSKGASKPKTKINTNSWKITDEKDLSEITSTSLPARGVRLAAGGES